MRNIFIIIMITPIFGLAQKLKISTPNFWSEENAKGDKIISASIYPEGLLIDASHRMIVTDAIAYYPDGSNSKLEFGDFYQVGSDSPTNICLFAPKENLKTIDSIVGTVNYFTPTEVNKSIYKVFNISQLKNQELIKGNYPLKAILLDWDDLSKIKNESAEAKKSYFKNLFAKTNYKVKNLNSFIKVFFKHYSENVKRENSFLLLSSNIEDTFIQFINPDGTLMQACAYSTYKDCGLYYISGCNSCGNTPAEKPDNLVFIFDNPKDIKSYNFKIANTRIKNSDEY